MTLSEAKKAADLRWQRKNTHIFSVRMSNREADALKAACQSEGITPHSVFLRAAREMIAAHAEPEKPSTASSSSGSTPDGESV